MKLISQHHLTQTQKRLINAAFDFCKKNNVNKIKANTFNIEFDFANNQGTISKIKNRDWTDEKYLDLQKFSY